MNYWLVVYRASCVVFALVLMAVVVTLFLPKIRLNRERQRKVSELAGKNRIQAEMVKKLKYQQEKFQTDPKYVERIAREELGKVKEGEMIYRYPDQKTNDIQRRRY